MSSPAPIAIHQEHETHYWLRKTSLIEVALSLDHLGHLPKNIGAKKGTGIEIKYLGGLHVLLEFGSSVEAKQFGDDTARNFAAITKQFRETIAPFNELSHRVDLSCAKIGILSNHRARINDEIHVACDKEILIVGVIEFHEDWFLFWFDHREIYPEDEYCRDVVTKDVGKKEEGIPITPPVIDVHDSDDTREEGEFVPEKPWPAQNMDTKHEKLMEEWKPEATNQTLVEETIWEPCTEVPEKDGAQRRWQCQKFRLVRE
ncbi:hypothetical protein LXL04_039056 [Taraxacum kok-saghyz]